MRNSTSSFSSSSGPLGSVFFLLLRLHSFHESIEVGAKLSEVLLHRSDSFIDFPRDRLPGIFVDFHVYVLKVCLFFVLLFVSLPVTQATSEDTHRDSLDLWLMGFDLEYLRELFEVRHSTIEVIVEDLSNPFSISFVIVVESPYVEPFDRSLDSHFGRLLSYLFVACSLMHLQHTPALARLLLFPAKE